MPDLLTTYSNYCGVKIKKRPSFPSNFCPIPDNNYITIHAGSGMEGKNYDYYYDVVSLLSPIAKEKGFSFLQIGGKDEPSIPGCFNRQGQTTMRQAAFVVKNASLHIGNDSIWAHYAGSYDVPYVTLYGSTLAEICKPSFGEGIAIESDRKGCKATNQISENPKTINFIKPEEVAKAVCSLLGWKWESGVDTLFMGEKYHLSTYLDIIPDAPSAHYGDLGLPDVRMDLFFSEENLAGILSQMPCTITTDKPINVGLLVANRARVSMVDYVSEDPDRDFCRELSASKIPYEVSVVGGNLEKVRLDLFDFKLARRFEKKKMPEIEGISEESFFRTTKFFISKGKVFPSLPHVKRGDFIPECTDDSFPIKGCIDEPEFWEELDFLYLLNEKKENTPPSV